MNLPRIRRMTTTLLSTLTAVLLASMAHAEKVHFVMTTSSISPGHSAISSLQQKPGFWKQEGLEVEHLAVRGSTKGMQQVASGNADAVSVSPEVLMIARSKGIKVVGVYLIVRDTIFRVVTFADSPVMSVADLKGKTISVPSLGSGTYPFSKALVSAAGLTPDLDVKWLATGGGPQSALAMQQNQVAALSIWDTRLAALETKGMSFRVLKEPYIDNLIGQVLMVREDYLASNRETIVKLARGIAKATLYGAAHPEETVKNHWALYPQSKPQGGDEAQLLKNAVHIMQSRYDGMANPDWPKTGFGHFEKAKWGATVEVAVKQGLIQSADQVAGAYTNDLIADINNFSKQEVLGQKID